MALLLWAAAMEWIRRRNGHSKRIICSLSLRIGPERADKAAHSKSTVTQWGSMWPTVWKHPGSDKPMPDKKKKNHTEPVSTNVKALWEGSALLNSDETHSTHTAFSQLRAKSTVLSKRPGLPCFKGAIRGKEIMIHSLRNQGRRKWKCIYRPVPGNQLSGLKQNSATLYLKCWCIVYSNTECTIMLYWQTAIH